MGSELKLGSADVALLPDLGAAPFPSALSDHAVQFTHGLAHDERLSLDALASLVARVPRSWVLAHHAQYSPHEPRALHAVDENADLAALVRDLVTTAVSFRMYNLEHTAGFHGMDDALRAPVSAFVGDREGSLDKINLATFFASAGAVTPAHPDRHHNLLLQVSGRKEVWVDNDPDPRRRHLRVIDYFRRPQDGAPELPPAQSFVLGPGEGVYIPPYAFHWTTVLDDMAVGFSVAFSTPASVRNDAVHNCDMRLRRLGFRPRPLDLREFDGIVARAKARLATAAAHLSERRSRS